MFRGFKKMTDEESQATTKFDAIDDPTEGAVERSQIFFKQDGSQDLRATPIIIGSERSVPIGADIIRPEARVHIHFHPDIFELNREGTREVSYRTYEPSAEDQMFARRYPNVSFLVAFDYCGKNEYVKYNGSMPMHHYLLVNDPLDRPHQRPGTPDTYVEGGQALTLPPVKDRRSAGISDGSHEDEVGEYLEEMQ